MNHAPHNFNQRQEATLADKVMLELAIVGNNHISSEQREEGLLVSGVMFEALFETCLAGGKHLLNHTPSAIAKMAYDLEQSVSILYLSTPELSLLLDYCIEKTGNQDIAPIVWTFTFPLTGGVRAEISIPALLSELLCTDKDGKWAFGHVGLILSTTHSEVGKADDLVGLVWKVAQSPLVIFLRGVGCALIQQGWSIKA